MSHIPSPPLERDKAFYTTAVEISNNKFLDFNFEFSFCISTTAHKSCFACNRNDYKFIFICIFLSNIVYCFYSNICKKNE